MRYGTYGYCFPVNTYSNNGIQSSKGYKFIYKIWLKYFIRDILLRPK